MSKICKGFVEILWLSALLFVLYCFFAYELPFDAIQPICTAVGCIERDIEPFDIYFTIVVLGVPALITMVRFSFKYGIKRKKKFYRLKPKGEEQKEKYIQIRYFFYLILILSVFILCIIAVKKESVIHMDNEGISKYCVTEKGKDGVITIKNGLTACL